jgi:hypothetical protein
MNPAGTNRHNEATTTINGVAIMAPSPAHVPFAGHALDFFEFAVL